MPLLSSSFSSLFLVFSSFVFFVYFFFFVISPTPNHQKLSVLWIGAGKPISPSGCLSSPETFWLACLFSVCGLQLMHIPLLTFNLPCKMDYLLVNDLWAAVTYRLYALLKYYNGQMWEMGKQSWDRNSDSGECWRKRWNEGMERRGMAVPFIEEGRQTSFIGGSVSPEWCHRGQHRIKHPTLTHSPLRSLFLPPDSSNISPSMPPAPFLLAPFSFTSIPHVGGGHCPGSQSN